MVKFEEQAMQALDDPAGATAPPSVHWVPIDLGAPRGAAQITALLFGNKVCELILPARHVYDLDFI